MNVIAMKPDFIIETPYKKGLSWPPSGVYSAWAWDHGRALAETCEDDLAILRPWFPSAAHFGPDNPVHVVIEAFPPAAPGEPPAPGGRNWGYDERGATKIQISPLWSADNPDEALRAIFVHELSEILMTAQHPQRWIPSNSMGEALAIVCAWLRYPDAFGPLVGEWLNYQDFSKASGGRAGFVRDWHRPNWIDRTDNETKGGGQLNLPAVACGILFIHYLRSFGSNLTAFPFYFSIEEIIANGAPKFRQVLDQLAKGRGVGDVGGSQAFFDLINLHFPEMPELRYEVNTDDLFPLPSLIRMTLDQTSVTGLAGVNVTVNGTVELDAPQKATVVTLFSSSPEFATVASTVTIPLNSATGRFSVNIPFHPEAFPPQTVQIWASYGGRSVVAALTVHSPLESEVGILKSVTVSPPTVPAGAESTCTVQLESAVSTDTVVGVAAVSSGGGPVFPRGPSSDLVIVPSRITVPATRESYQFPILTLANNVTPHSTYTVTIAANAVLTKTAILTISGG